MASDAKAVPGGETVGYIVTTRGRPVWIGSAERDGLIRITVHDDVSGARRALTRIARGTRDLLGYEGGPYEVSQVRLHVEQVGEPVQVRWRKEAPDGVL